MKRNLAKCLIMSMLFIGSTAGPMLSVPAATRTTEVRGVQADGKTWFEPEPVYRVTITAYSSTPDQTDSTPFITASGRRVSPLTLAVSRDLLAAFPYGTVVCLEGRTLRVDDNMDVRWTKRVDVWHTSRGAALRFGVRTGLLRRGACIK